MRITGVFILLLTTAIMNGCMMGKGKMQSLKTGEEMYFSLNVQDQIIGYNTYKITEKRNQAGKDVFIIKFHTFIKINMPGGEKILDYTGETHLFHDYTPAYYSLIMSDGKSTETIEITPETLNLPEKTYLCDGNIFDHSVYLFRALQLKKGEMRTINLLIPQVKKEEVVTATVEASDKEDEVLSGKKKFRAFPVKLTIDGFPEQTFRVTASGEQVKLEIPSQDFVLEISDPSIITRVKGIEMSRLLKDLFIDSNEAFSFMMNVSYMKAGLKIKVTGEKVESGFLSSHHQSFNGTVKDNLITGTFENRIARYSGENAVTIPVEETPELTEYLEREIKIESDDPDIINKAKEITGDTKNGWEAVKAICEWVYKNIRYEITGSGAKQALIDLKGDCGPHALLAIAMARSCGIPSKLVGGIMYSNGQFGQHYWIETYMGEAGWIPSDPTVGEFGWIDATHIRLFEYGGVEKIHSLKVIDFIDEGRNLGDMEKRQLMLQESYKRHYSFLKNNTKFATNECRVETIETIEGNIIYTIISKLNIDYNTLGTPKTLDLDAVFKIDDNCIPVSCKMDALVGEQKQTIDCTFMNDKAHDIVVVGDETHEKEIDLENNTILLENNMVCLFDLMYRSLPLKTGETFHVPAFFPGRFLKLTITIEVRENMEEIEVNGKNYRVFVCVVPMLKEIDYVTEEGMLVKLEVPAQKVVVELE